MLSRDKKTSGGSPSPSDSSHATYANHPETARTHTPPVVKDDSASEVLSAAGINLSADDATIPCLTLRMWAIGIFFTLLGSGLNTLYTLRFPSISLSQSAVQFLAFPIGRAWEKLVPDWTVSLFGWKLRLNPGRFSEKVPHPSLFSITVSDILTQEHSQENILIFIMANLSFQTRLSADVLTEQRVFFGYETGWGFEVLITLATILYGLALAGICKSIVVEPVDMLWPGVFANTALNRALHAGKKDDAEAV
jgi:hypothetical protein